MHLIKISFLIGRRDPDRAEEILFPNIVYGSAPSIALLSSDVEEHGLSNHPNEHAALAPLSS